MADLEPRGMVGIIYVGDHQTLLYTKYISCAPHGYKKNYYKSMQAIDPQVHDEFATPKGLIGRIYVA